MKTAEKYKPFGMEWELEMLKFKKQELVEILRSALSKNVEIISLIDEMIEETTSELENYVNPSFAFESLQSRIITLQELKQKIEQLDKGE